MKIKIFCINIVLFTLCILFARLICAQDVSRFIDPSMTTTISMDFKDASLTDILKIFSQQSGLNFIAAQNISDKKISLFLDNVPVQEALERILTANDLTYELQPESNIFIVKTLEKNSVQLLTRIYRLKHATVGTSKLNQTISINANEGTGSSSAGGSTATTSAATGGGQLAPLGLLRL